LIHNRAISNTLPARVIAGLGFVLLAVFFTSAPARAHNTDATGRTQLTAAGETLTARIDAPPAFVLDAADEGALRAESQRYFSEHLSIRLGDGACPFTAKDANYTDTGYLRVTGSFTCPAPVERLEALTIRATAYQDLNKWEHKLNVAFGSTNSYLLFNATAQDYPGTVKALPSEPVELNPWANAWSFFKLGVHHILTGYDHILFLLLAILLVRGWLNLLILITIFTAAHSITLILAGLGIVELPARLIEPIIALSIVYMAWLNLRRLRSDQTGDTERRLTTGGFGLVHGLGFAGMLAATPIPSSQTVLSLAVFNVGVEVGQVLVLAVAVPLLLLADRSRHRRRILLGASFIFGGLAFIWFIQRLL
jgi:hypothetical protein